MSSSDDSLSDAESSVDFVEGSGVGGGVSGPSAPFSDSTKEASLSDS